MSDVPSDLKYTREHEWIRLEGDRATVGITDHAQESLSDVVYVELPRAGDELKKGGEAAVLESTKAAASVYAPADGKVAEANEALEGDPGAINRDCYGEGWIYKIDLADASALDEVMDADAYQKFLAEQE
jgi:glycine cleavage system H protein